MTHKITSLDEATLLAVQSGHTTVSACAAEIQRNGESTRARLMKMCRLGLLNKQKQPTPSGSGIKLMIHFYVISDDYVVDDTRTSLPFGTNPLYPMMAAIRAMVGGETTCAGIADKTEYGICRTRHITRQLVHKGYASIKYEGFAPRSSLGRPITPTAKGIKAQQEFFKLYPDASRHKKVNTPKQGAMEVYDAMDEFLRRPA